MSTPGGSRVLVALRVPAPPVRTFDASTSEIASWWRPNRLFAFTIGKTGTMAFEPGPHGRLVERYDDGTEFTIGHVLAWEPPARLVFSWRQASFADDEQTEVHVGFDDVGDGQTRVTVEHFGWDTLARSHVARHGFPLAAFQQRHAEWWQALLAAMARTAATDS